MSDKVKTITLRTLLREPLKVKRMTRAGQTVQVTDKGGPLWILQAAPPSHVDEAERRRAIDELLDEVLRSPRSKIPLSKIILESRR